MAYADPSVTGRPAAEPHSAPGTYARVVRMVCGHCGSHVVVARTSRLGGQCLNCASYELRPLRFEQQRTDPPLRPGQRTDVPAPW
jgi:hypothetical protein